MAAKARIILSGVAAAELYTHVPSWHACILGPIPFGQSTRYRGAVNQIIKEDRAGAEEACEFHIREVCEQYGYEYDPDEWSILHLVQTANCS